AGNAAVARLLAGPYGSPVPRPTTEVVQRNAQDVLPPPMAVTWGSDPFLMSFARSASGDRLEVTVRYQGTHPFDGPNVRGNTWSASVDIGTSPMSARLRSRGETWIELDLYGDSSKLVKLGDRPSIGTRPF